jgi:hypothetical protein
VLVGHVVYGLIAGLVYGAFDRLWVRFFTESDPIHREPEGPGVSALHSLKWGALASLASGLALELVLVASGAMSPGASTGGGSPALHREAPSFGSAVVWGLLFGLIRWYVDPLTLEPILPRGAFDWSVGAASALLPSLVGQLLFGAVTAWSLLALEKRHAAWLRLDPASPLARRSAVVRREPPRRPLGVRARHWRAIADPAWLKRAP